MMLCDLLSSAALSSYQESRPPLRLRMEGGARGGDFRAAGGEQRFVRLEILAGGERAPLALCGSGHGGRRGRIIPRRQ